MKVAILGLVIVGIIGALLFSYGSANAQQTVSGSHKFSVTKTDAEWRKALTDAQYKVLRQKDTEQAYTGKYWNNHAAGTYVCAACGQELFSSKTKFESGTGWPSFWEPIKAGAVVLQDDRSWAAEDRTEVLCSRCGGHLGHVFDDGPKPTGKRYCMNSVAMIFKPAKK